MALCGMSIAGFTLSVFCDVVTREIGRPWLWLQLVTTGFFAWGVFIGMAVATRRLDHLNLVEITKGMSGPKRTFMEIFNRLVILAVGARDGGVRHSEFPARHGQLSRAVADPARDLHGERADRRRADRACSASSRSSMAGATASRGRKTKTISRGSSDGQRFDHPAHDRPVPAVRLHGRAGRVRPDGRRAGRLHAHADQHAVDDRADVPRHRFRDPAGGAVLPAGRRIDDLGRRDQPHDPAGADHGRPSARRARAGRHAVQHVLRRHFRLVDRGRRGAEPHRRGGDDAGKATTAPSRRR